MEELHAELQTDENRPFVDAREKWLSELRAAHREVEDFHERGDKIIQHYSEDRKVRRARKYPLFNSNVGILENALFARIPRPDVARRFKDPDDQVGRVASLILQRALITELEGVGGGFKTVAKALIKDLLVPGAGFARVSYEVDQEEVSVTSSVADAQSELPEASPVIKDQQTPITYVHWKDVRWSPCRMAAEMRWQAFGAYLNKEAAEKRFKEKAKYLSFTISPGEESENESQNKLEPQALIWEIWDRQTMKVYFICETCPVALDIRDDPLGLPEFFPAPPELLVAHTTNERLLPVSDFTILQDQYNELNEVNNRISRAVRACRIAGTYDKSQPAVKQVLEGAAEHQLVPVDTYSQFKEKGGLAGAIDFLPLQENIAMLAQLERQREAIKQQIYELTGISDIVRGVSSPYETAQAQGMKAQYASIRLQGKQTDVAQYLTSLIQRKAFLMLRFYEPKRLLERCGALPQADHQYVPQALALLKNDLMASLKLEISTDALQQPNWARDQQERSQTITSLSQLLAPVVQQVPGAMQALAPLYGHIVKWAVAGSSGAREIEGVLEMGLQQLMQSTQQPQEPKPDPAAEAAKAQQALEAQKLEAEKAKFAAEMQFEREKFMAEMQLKRDIAMAELKQKDEAAFADHQLKGEIERAKAAQKQVPQYVHGNVGLDEASVVEAIATVVQQTQKQTVEAVGALQQSTLQAITALATQPQDPVRVVVERQADGSLKGVLQ